MKFDPDFELDVKAVMLDYRYVKAVMLD